MIYVSACNKNGGIFICDKNKVTRIIDGDFRGIDVDENYLYAAQRDGVSIFNKNTWKLVGQFSTEGDNHGLKVKNGKGYLLDSSQDKLTIFDIESYVIIETLGLNKTGHLRHHCNDLFIQNNSLLISMFSFVAQENYVSGVPCVREYNMDGKIISEYLYPGAAEIHSVVCFENDLYICDSTNGQIWKGDKILYSFPSFYTRGLLVRKDVIFIGVSIRRGTQKGFCGIIKIRHQESNWEFIPIDATEIYGITED